MSETSFHAILLVLADHGVEFVVVGGVSAVLQGAPLVTSDLDVVHSRAERNIERLLQALEDLDAHYRTQPERRLAPNASHLRTAGHQLLATRFGPLDLLGEIGADRQRFADPQGLQCLAGAAPVSYQSGQIAKVHLRYQQGKGAVEIHFFTDEDLERILQLILGEGE